MATKTRSGGSVASQNEDFKPISEWKEEEGANILLLHLPGFQKEQIKITYVQSNRVIRVVGERPITNSKSLRFNQTFSVPQNSDVQKINAKFQTATLTITIPKLTITKPSTTTEISANEKEEIDRTLKTPQTTTPQPPPSLTDDTMINENHEKLKANHRNDKKTEPAVRQKALFEQEVNKNISKKRKESLEAPSDEESTKKTKEGEREEKTNSSEKEKSDNKLVEKRKEDLFDEKVKKNVNAAASRKTVMGLAMELSQDKQSLVNIGVAILVIAALGAYISYTYGPAGNSKD